MLQSQFKRRSKKVVWNGVEYSSIATAAAMLGINACAMQYRVQKGYKSDDDMFARGGKRGIACIWNGIEYISLSAAARANGISLASMWRYLARGYTSDADMASKRMTISFGCTGAKPTVWNGIEYPSIAAAAREVGVSQRAMQKRLVKSYTCDDDLKVRR